MSIVWLDGRDEEEEEDSVVARIVHHKFEEYITLHDPYLRDDGLLLSYVDLVNEKRVDAYAFDRADSFGTFRKMRVIFFSVKREKNRIETKAGEKRRYRSRFEKLKRHFETAVTKRKTVVTDETCALNEQHSSRKRMRPCLNFFLKARRCLARRKHWRKMKRRRAKRTI